MSSLLRSFLAVALAFIVATMPAHAGAQSPSTPAPCVLGYTLGFFNGVWNTELEAVDGRNALQDAFEEVSGRTDDTYQGEDVNYELFYNHTGATVGAGALQDIAEVFVQRANELDPTGELSKNGFYFFWESYTGDTPGYANTAGNSNSSILSFIADFNNAVVQGAATSLAALLSSPPTTSDYANQQAQLDQLAAAGRKFVLVAHSQGNLFVNQAYDHIQPAVGSNRVQAVHIAPASPTLRGPWLLSQFDLVINGLRLLNGTNTVPNINIDIPFSSEDPSGHTLVGTYLDGSRAGRGTAEGLLMGAFSALEQGTCGVKVSPASSQLSPMDTQTLTATLDPAPQDTNIPISYKWTISGTATGTFASTGNSQPVLTTSNTITYVANPNSAPGAIDTVSVTAYAGKAIADPSVDEVLGTTTSVMTISYINLSLSPATTTLIGVGNATLTAALSGINTTGFSYHWVVTPAITGGSLVGYLGEIGGGNRSNLTDYCSTSLVALYSNTISNVSALTTASTDVVTVTAYSGANCTVGNQAGVNVTQVGAARTAVVTTDLALNVTPATTALNGNGSVTLSASASGGTQLSNASYQWSTAGAAGTLTGGTTNYCSTSAQTTYTTTPSVVSGLATAVTDAVKVTAFSGSGCVATNQIGQGSAKVTVSPLNAKDLAAWEGAWTCTENGYIQTIDIIGAPYPTSLIPYEPNSNYPPDLFIMYTNTNNPITVGAYGLFINTLGLNGWDARAPNAQTAYNAEYENYSIVGGTLTWTDIDNGVLKTCTR
jgi:hypothetical protein